MRGSAGPRGGGSGLRRYHPESRFAEPKSKSRAALPSLWEGWCRHGVPRRVPGALSTPRNGGDEGFVHCPLTSPVSQGIALGWI